MVFHLDILETYKFGFMNSRNIFGERCENNNTMVYLNFEKRFLYRYKNNLRVKTSKMFWTIFTLNNIYNTENCYYLPTELIMEIIYNIMYWFLQLLINLLNIFKFILYCKK